MSDTTIGPTTDEQRREVILAAIVTRLLAAEALLNMERATNDVWSSLRATSMANADVDTVSALLTMHKRVLGEQHQLLLDQLRALQNRLLG